MQNNKKKKSIVCVIGNLSSGGAEHQLLELSRLLYGKGYDVTIVTYLESGDFYEVPSYIHRVRIGLGKSKLKKAIGLMQFCFKQKNKVVISYSQRTSCFVLSSLFFKRSTKVIASERNFTTGTPSVYEKWLMNLLYYRADYVVPNSYSQRNYILNKRGNWSSKVVTITNYTDLSKYKYSLQPKNDLIRIGVFARYHFQKNYERLAKAVNILKDRTDKKFVIEWFGDKQMKERELSADYIHFKEMVDGMNLSDYIHLNGRILDVASKIQQFDVMCLPSLFEGFSNSISEYICCGRPVLASDVSDNSVMVRNGENGFLFDPHDEKSICDAFIKFFALTEEEREKMGSRSREIAEELFNEERFVEKYIELIEAPK